MWISAQYVSNPLGTQTILATKEDGSVWGVPLDPANSDYRAIMALVEAGDLVIAPAEE